MVRVKEGYLKVIMDDLDNHPHCPHGPTLLFKRILHSKERMFYACAACRDRKLCSFFHWADMPFSANKRIVWELKKREYLSKHSHSECYEHFCQVKHCIPSKGTGYCHTCSMLLLPNEVQQHTKHDITLGITLQQISHPTELLKPLETNTKEAQYLFSKNAIRTILEVAENINVKHLICIGAPRVHEHVRSDHYGDMKSLLLDIDRRYHNFYKPGEFCWFNAFNNHFFYEDTSKQVLTKYLQQEEGENMMIIMDPPFGGRIEPLAHTFNQIKKLHRELNPHLKKDMTVMLISPYFMEAHILASFPGFHMLDYKVTYDNHPLFSHGSKCRKQGSPVRIFTDIPLKMALLPQEEGYSFCESCERWVSEENKHCEYCNKCTSKNGSTYTHCSICQCCVKPTWEHCEKCNRCCLAPHECSAYPSSKHCYKCGETGHKMMECPEKARFSPPLLIRKTNKRNIENNKRSKKKRRKSFS